MAEAKPPESVQRIQKTGSTLWLVLVSSCRWVDVQLLPSLTLVTFYFFAFMRESPSTDKCQGCQEGQPTHKHICTINLTSEWSRWRNLLCIHGDARWNIFPGFDPILSCPVLSWGPAGSNATGAWGPDPDSHLVHMVKAIDWRSTPEFTFFIEVKNWSNWDEKEKEKSRQTDWMIWTQGPPLSSANWQLVLQHHFYLGHIVQRDWERSLLSSFGKNKFSL